ncbi:mechanosensitive ion channel domain-containing protein [Reyranella sp.]|uniref:mechanosensitive ion channel family protein n=1 Tax=Reyranella sp. TaxID=1929291 RepID=UPI0025FCC16B|nr:mechanosensitive ion channel domain-containing protein [Reyranella sp.]
MKNTIDWMEHAVAWAPNWVIACACLVIAATVAVTLHGATLRLLRRLVPPSCEFLHSLISATQALLRVGLAVFAVALVLPIVPLEREARAFVGHWLVVAFIILLGWSCTAAITLASDYYLRRPGIDFSGDPLGRKHLTQVRVLRRVASTVVVLVTVAAALMTFEAVKQYGVSLIASAGAAGLVVGLAARPLLTNLFAGIQIAITQPIRIGDAVIVENEWGWVEEITGTYVVIKIWDWRRMVVPLSYFLERPFQNWTRHSSDLIGSVMLWVDYTVPVARIRTKLEELVRTSKLWDGQVVNLQVVDSSERAAQLRALVSARTSPEAWDLRCEVREKLIAFLQDQYPTALPKQRAEVVPAEATSLPGREKAASI